MNAPTPRVSKKGCYVKGRRFEYEVRDDFINSGLSCRRVLQSGSGIEKGDLVLTCHFGEQRGEAKRRRTLPTYLTEALSQGHDFTVFREDRGETFVLITLDRFKQLVSSPCIGRRG